MKAQKWKTRNWKMREEKIRHMGQTNETKKSSSAKYIVSFASWCQLYVAEPEKLHDQMRIPPPQVQLAYIPCCIFLLGC